MALIKIYAVFFLQIFGLVAKFTEGKQIKEIIKFCPHKIPLLIKLNMRTCALLRISTWRISFPYQDWGRFKLTQEDARLGWDALPSLDHFSTSFARITAEPALLPVLADVGRCQIKYEFCENWKLENLIIMQPIKKHIARVQNCHNIKYETLRFCFLSFLFLSFW